MKSLECWGCWFDCLWCVYAAFIRDPRRPLKKTVVFTRMSEQLVSAATTDMAGTEVSLPGFIGQHMAVMNFATVRTQSECLEMLTEFCDPGMLVWSALWGLMQPFSSHAVRVCVCVFAV